MQVRKPACVAIPGSKADQAVSRGNYFLQFLKMVRFYTASEGAVFNCEAVKPISFFWISQPT
jgi:hypothetical protein